MRKFPGSKLLRQAFHDGQIEIFRSSKSTAIIMPLLAVASVAGYATTHDPAYLKLFASIVGVDAALGWSAAKIMPWLRTREATAALDVEQGPSHPVRQLQAKAQHITARAA